ncbi:HAMP domain-containing sensor histidine kinase [Nocardioides sp. CER19]|uniref:HAMP domain-containing sensor histidine kinase n=1 Tax=Nocardioides sp. CER19 TaxID=3038538 RepID=UPI00244ABB72|nr:HAMP domain-containing sensor histidine kinase [Nocardioides sp. CER19]MDH2413755.1 HAMP domain-containing sensor histidine kinase [Nocardioides sp. CER19]
MRPARPTPWRPHLRLRNRVALGFGVMALLLSTAIALTVWSLAAHYVNRDNVLTARAEASDNAELISAEIADGVPPSDRLLDLLDYAPGTAAVLLVQDHVYRNQEAESLVLPTTLVQDLGADGGPSTVTVDGKPYLEVVSASHPGDRAYVELRPLDDLRHTLTRTWQLLIGAILLATALGAGFGLFASRRMLRPLSDVTQAASAIAHGDLTTRLVPRGDPDLDDLARSFNRTASELEQRVRADARFAGDVSHELRTPLTTMLNSLALLENRRAALPSEVAEPLDLLSEDLHRFRALVIDLLEISRFDEGRATVEPEPVLVGELVARAADTAAGRPVTVVRPSADGLVVNVDKRRLQLVVVNLVRNAETHGVSCRAVTVSAAGSTVRITVDDAGPGVPPDRRGRVFDRFARGTSSHVGTGLGLAIASRNVLLHGGAILVEEAPGGGARFVVELPVDVRRPQQHVASEPVEATPLGARP